jgi:hypothetical protein
MLNHWDGLARVLCLVRFFFVLLLQRVNKLEIKLNSLHLAHR